MPKETRHNGKDERKDIARMLSLNYFVTSNSITLYWEKPSNLSKEYCFHVYVDG